MIERIFMVPRGWRYIQCRRCWGRGAIVGTVTTMGYVCPECGGSGEGFAYDFGGWRGGDTPS